MRPESALAAAEVGGRSLYEWFGFWAPGALVGQGPAPADVALYLRVELNGVDCVRGPDGRLVAGRDELLQLQQFWTLVHDGTQWRLDAVEEARADAQDLPKVTALPPLLEWRRPAPEGDEN